MKKVFHPKHSIKAATGSLEDFMMAVEDKIDELEGDVDASTYLDPEDLENVDNNSAIFAYMGDPTNLKEFSNYGDFVYQNYPEFGIEQEDMDEEVYAVEDELSAYGKTLDDCPTYWADNYEEPIIKIDDRYYFVAVRGDQARFTPVDAIDDISNYGLGEDVSSTSQIVGSERPRDRYYFGKEEYEQYGDMVSEELSGMVISKRIDDSEEPGGLVYEAERIGMDMWDLLRCLEGMCYNGKATEISDYQYRVN